MKDFDFRAMLCLRVFKIVNEKIFQFANMSVSVFNRFFNPFFHKALFSRVLKQNNFWFLSKIEKA